MSAFFFSSFGLDDVLQLTAHLLKGQMAAERTFCTDFSAAASCEPVLSFGLGTIIKRLEVNTGPSVQLNTQLLATPRIFLAPVGVQSLSDRTHVSDKWYGADLLRSK